ncbi:hydrolase [Lactococcus hodotermopsidis]|uniref:Hydrolase n=1 Tax=Pseudolactococcus hodotermopsidis TaxID=2709157 RepID=A0A6A0BGJ8_9LACT|nr:HAD-IA family hydrolase [Lactococcus hodotermopsidis]GFH43391.1 hydrolase [Lactococcus hodotermopsidis]
MSYTDYIWDLGGTLMDNYQTSATAFKMTLQAFGVNVAYDEIYTALRVSTDFAVSKFAASLPNFTAIYKKREAETLAQPVLFADATRVLATIVKKGGRNFMISHRNNQVLDILKSANIICYFTEVVTADNGFPRKPNPDSINYLLDKYEMTQAVMIGDRKLDITAGQNAKIDTIYFGNDNKIKATYQISRLAEILEL